MTFLLFRTIFQCHPPPIGGGGGVQKHEEGPGGRLFYAPWCTGVGRKGVLAVQRDCIGLCGGVESKRALDPRLIARLRTAARFCLNSVARGHGRTEL